MASKKELPFETSLQLKDLFRKEFDLWKKRERGDLQELADRCGLSHAYLAHVGRYGRVPGKAVLILLAFNFKIDGQALFDAAGLHEKFPYESGLSLNKEAASEQGIFSVKFDMEALNRSILSAVRSEIRSRRPQDLLGGRPLRIGVNYHHPWMFTSPNPPANQDHRGVFPDFCKTLGIALQRDVEMVHVPYADFLDQLTSGKIDIFGPTTKVPNLPTHIFYSKGLYRLGITALFRTKPATSLEPVKVPESFDDLRDEKYQIAVLKNSVAHLICNTRLRRSDGSLIMCSSDGEGIERVLLKGLQKPAHLFITNTITANITAQEHGKDLEIAYHTRKSLIDKFDCALAIRPDWPEMLGVINDALDFLKSRGGFSKQFEQLFKQWEHAAEVV